MNFERVKMVLSLQGAALSRANYREIADALALFVRFPNGRPNTKQPHVTWFLSIRQPGLVHTEMQEKTHPGVSFAGVRLLEPEGIGLDVKLYGGELLPLELLVENFPGPFGILARKTEFGVPGYPLFVTATPQEWKFETTVRLPKSGTITTYIEQELSYTLSVSFHDQ